MDNEQHFDAGAYWQRRLEALDGLAGVGAIGLGEKYNRWLYRVRKSNFLRMARRMNVPTSRVLDVGSGTGFYIDLWRSLGAHITGSDLTAVAVERLVKRYPDQQIVRLDVGQPLPDMIAQYRFGAVSAMDVLFHIIDDSQFAQAIWNLASLLEDGGYLFLSDVFPHRPYKSPSHVLHRTLQTYTDALTSAGLEVVERRPIFVLMNEPVDSTNPLHRLWWRLLSGTIDHANSAGGGIGAVLFPAEVGLASLMRDGPSTELMVCRRASRTDASPVKSDHG